MVRGSWGEKERKNLTWTPKYKVYYFFASYCFSSSTPWVFWLEVVSGRRGPACGARSGRRTGAWHRPWPHWWCEGCSRSSWRTSALRPQCTPLEKDKQSKAENIRWMNEWLHIWHFSLWFHKTQTKINISAITPQHKRSGCQTNCYASQPTLKNVIDRK